MDKVKKRQFTKAELPDDDQELEALNVVGIKYYAYVLFFNILDRNHELALEMVIESKIAFDTYERARLKAGFTHDEIMTILNEDGRPQEFANCAINTGASYDEITEARNAGFNVKIYEHLRGKKCGLDHDEIIAIGSRVEKLSTDYPTADVYALRRRLGVDVDDVVKLMTEHSQFVTSVVTDRAYILAAGGSFDEIDDIYANKDINFEDYAQFRLLAHRRGLVLTAEEAVEIVTTMDRRSTQEYAKLRADEPTVTHEQAMSVYRAGIRFLTYRAALRRGDTHDEVLVSYRIRR